jgi:phosphate starvation-inducible protein PhoH
MSNRRSRKKAQCAKKEQIEVLTEALYKNGIAMAEDRKKKSWTIHDLRAIKPLNEPQRQMFESYFSGNNIIANGSAGTGKTLAGMYLALTDVLSKDAPQKRIIIVRSAVASREIGHLPGTVDEKLAPYEAPYRDIVSFLVGNYNAYDDMKAAGIIEFMPTSHLRGLNWDDAVILVDELQNLTFHEVNTVMTRVGVDSSIILIGDQIQTDLYKSHNDQSGMQKFLKVASRMPDLDEVVFTKADILRSEFVKSWICALEEAV